MKSLDHSTTDIFIKELKRVAQFDPFLSNNRDTEQKLPPDAKNSQYATSFTNFDLKFEATCGIPNM